MSELKVNKITPKTGTSIQLGESGDTITIPCGATLTNNGTATGFGLSFCTTVKTSPFTATANKGFLINTGSAVTVTLPASPSTGDEVIIVDQTGQAATNNITLGRNGSKIKGSCIDATMSTNRGGLRLVYSGSSQGWITATAGNDEIANTAQFVSATGGTITTSGNFKIHTFNSDANFVVSNAGNSEGSNTVDYLVVAGGGGGGAGAGGFRESSGSASGCYSASPLGSGVSALPVTAQSYPITVGGGGASTTGAGVASAGSNSVFSTITSAGGGQGGTAFGYASYIPSPGSHANGGSGGSGGGGGISDNPSYGTAGSGNTPSVSPPQGNNGGLGYTPSPITTFAGAGGGGATAAGSNITPTSIGGAGGAGATSSINETPTARAGGGSGGGGSTPAPGGTGGGGAGGKGAPPIPAGGNGTANTGGGGGGVSQKNLSGGTGGSGVVIIRYKFQ